MKRPGLMNFPFEGLTSGSKYGTAVGIIMFMLVIGGAFGIVMRTGTIDNGILALIRHTAEMKFSLFLRCLFCFTWRRNIWYGRRGRRLCHYHRTANGPAGL